MSFYAYQATSLSGSTIKMDQFKDHVVLLVNTASKCGLAPQLKELEELYQKYKEEKFVVLGFPSDQFFQELSNNEKIGEYCQKNFGVSFPIFEKIHVNGKNTHPIFKYLKSQKGGLLGSRIKWNFTKFLIDREGKVVKRYAPSKSPLSFEKEIKELL